MGETLSIAAALLDAARNRGRLALAESEVAVRDVVGILVAIAAALFLFILFGLALTLAFAAFVWPLEQRVLYLVGLGILYAAGAAASVMIARRRLSAWSPLPETRNQLAEDCEALQRHFKTAPSAEHDNVLP